MSSLTIEVLSWVLEKQAAVEASSVYLVSNILFLCYLFVAISLSKSLYLGAFLLSEMILYFFIPGNISDYIIFIVNVAIYSIMYWVVTSTNNIDTLNAYVIMILFQMAMALDAFIYPKDKTFLYSAYEYIFMAIHLYIINTLIPRKLIGRCLEGLSNRIFNLFGYNYNFALLLL